MCFEAAAVWHACSDMAAPVTGRRGLVLAALFHPKELMLVTAGDDAEVRVWDLITKACVATLKVEAPLFCGVRSAL